MDETRILGDYKLIKQVGQGSLGALHLAEHRFTKKQYALKILPEELTQDRAFCSRFEDEIVLLSSIDHPHVIKINNVSFAQGSYFLTEDFIVDDRGESRNLWHYYCARNKQLSEEDIIACAVQLSSTLDWLQEKKLAHRGIKWNNILVGPPKSSDEPFHLYLSDFGLSRIIGPGAVLTRSFKAYAEALNIPHAVPNQRIGNDRYPVSAIDPLKLSSLHLSFLQNFSFFAPEQKRVDDAGDAAFDTYAFGILIYYLIVGNYPEGIFQMPSVARRDFTCNWDLVVQECLQQNPAMRPKSLRELIYKATSIASLCAISVEQCLSPSLQHVEDAQALLEPVFAAVDVPSTVQQFELFQQPRPVEAPLFSLERSVKEYHPEKREIRIIKPLASEMVVIAKDEYFRGNASGCRDEMPRHQVKLNAYAIDTHPVTNEQFVRFLESIGDEKDAQNHDIIRLRESRIKKSTGKYSIEPGYAKHPVVGVTWYGACAYAGWIGKRLPTEAEWEVACCGTLENPLYPTGETIEKTQANFFSSDTTAVMSYPPNGLGLYDMAGNVYEWCKDWYDYNFYETASQEPGAINGPLQGVYRVLRGGCWKSLKEDLRCSKRHRNNPGAANGTYGFRCAADV